MITRLMFNSCFSYNSLPNEFVLMYCRVDDFHYENMQEPKIGAAFFFQILSLTEATVKFDKWDTAGQERYHGLAPLYYIGAAAVVVYDISSMVIIHYL